MSRGVANIDGRGLQEVDENGTPCHKTIRTDWIRSRKSDKEWLLFDVGEINVQTELADYIVEIDKSYVVVLSVRNATFAMIVVVFVVE